MNEPDHRSWDIKFRWITLLVTFITAIFGITVFISEFEYRAQKEKDDRRFEVYYKLSRTSSALVAYVSKEEYYKGSTFEKLRLEYASTFFGETTLIEDNNSTLYRALEEYYATAYYFDFRNAKSRSALRNAHSVLSNELRSAIDKATFVKPWPLKIIYFLFGGDQ